MNAKLETPVFRAKLRRAAQDRLFAARRSASMAQAAKDKAWLERADLLEREAQGELNRIDSLA